jgi:hypothetical protein
VADVNLLDAIPKIIGIVAVCVAVLGAAIQYIINSRAEHRQREAANLQSDIEVSKVFSELIEVANGSGGRSEPQDKIIDIINASLPPNLLMTVIANDPRDVGKLFAGSIVSFPTALARQLAAAESIVNLAIKYPILLEPALVGLDVIAGFSPFAKEAFKRLVRHYDINRALTEWGPNWQGYARGHISESETEGINTNKTV